MKPLIHIGCAKSASTSIQNYLSSCRDYKVNLISSIGLYESESGTSAADLKCLELLLKDLMSPDISW
jgi:hypothetical protein